MDIKASSIRVIRLMYDISLIRDDTPLGKLMHDFHCIEPENMNYNTLNRHTCRYKEEMEETKMSELMEEYGAKRERRGEARGKAIGEARVPTLWGENKLSNLGY